MLRRNMLIAASQQMWVRHFGKRLAVVSARQIRTR
jgi:hypothetical protein